MESWRMWEASSDLGLMLDGLNMAANEGDELGPESEAEVVETPNEGDALVGPEGEEEVFGTPNEEAGEESGDAEEGQDLEVGQSANPVRQDLDVGQLATSARQSEAEEGGEEQDNLKRWKGWFWLIKQFGRDTDN